MRPPTLFDRDLQVAPDVQPVEPTAAEARAAAIAQAEANASQAWRRAATDSVLEVARRQHRLTTDDVIELLESQHTDVATGNLAALGPVMQAAARARWIRSTADYTPTRIPRRHRDVRIWESLICDGERSSAARPRQERGRNRSHPQSTSPLEMSPEEIERGRLQRLRSATKALITPLVDHVEAHGDDGVVDLAVGVVADGCTVEDIGRVIEFFEKLEEAVARDG